MPKLPPYVAAKQPTPSAPPSAARSATPSSSVGVATASLLTLPGAPPAGAAAAEVAPGLRLLCLG